MEGIIVIFCYQQQGVIKLITQIIEFILMIKLVKWLLNSIVKSLKTIIIHLANLPANIIYY